MKIAASTVPAETVLPKLLLEFRRQFPSVRESVTVSDSAQDTQSVANGKADLGLVGELPRSSQLSSQSIGTDELVLVTSPSDVMAGKKSVSPTRLRSEPLIVREPGSDSRRCVERALETAGVSLGEPNVVMEMNTNDAIRRAVAQGMGAAFLSRSVVDGDIANERLRSISVTGVRPRRQLYLVTDSERNPTPAMRAFFGFAETWLAKSGRMAKKK